MKILQFKLGGEYDYNITFETITEKRKIQTNEAPQGDLISAVSSVVVASVKFFRFEDISAMFRQIFFSYPENGPNGFVLEIMIKTKENVYVKHVLKTEKLDLVHDDTASDNWEVQNRINQNNTLVEKIKTLREEIESYVSGSRMQQDLPFGGEELSLLDEMEEGGDKQNDEFDITAAVEE